jgi:hypothetical protein
MQLILLMLLQVLHLVPLQQQVQHVLCDPLVMLEP